ncbi:MAG: LysE family translocator [Pseudomonadota bacterium]
MSLELYIAFLLASVIVVAIPGPNVTLIIARALGHGRRAAMATVLGTTLAQAFSLALVIAGMTTAIALFARWFELLRWLGVAYLGYLAYRQWRSPSIILDDIETQQAPHKRLFLEGAMVAATNPKTLLFFAAFLPQFIDPARPVPGQMALLSLSYLAIAFCLDSGYGLAAARLRPYFATRRAARVKNRVAASCLGVAALGLALARR